MNPRTDWPAPDEERRLLTELDTDDRTAREAVAVRFLPLLTHFLAGAFPRVAADQRDDAADRALIDFLNTPHRFDPARGTLGLYLRMAARSDLRNLLDGDRHARRGIPLDSVAEPVDHRNGIRDDELTWDDPRLVAGRATLDAAELVTLELMRDGARDTATFAAHLGFDHLSAAEQVAAVKRVKDRVKKRLVRAVEDFR